MELVKGKIGEVGAYDVKFESGNLVVDVGATLPVVGASLVVKIDSGALCDLIAAKIPGQLDDAVLKLIKAGLAGA